VSLPQVGPPAVADLVLTVLDPDWPPPQADWVNNVASKSLAALRGSEESML